MQAHLALDASTVFLWTLPMFHCNGWCFPWAVTGVGATHVGLRRVEPVAVWKAIQQHGVTHLNAAPTVLVDLVDASAAPKHPLDRALRVATGGAPPSPSLLDRLAALNISVTHLYGLTETYGPAALCDWRPEWNGLAADARASLLARQGVGNVVSAGLRVVDERGNDVPADGETIGEIVIRGDNVMLGYYRDDEATQRAALDGWFRSGDLATMDADGYVSICDRAKDVIISGGENIGSVEIEHALAAHPAVAECAVVAAPDDRWGEVPVAYVQLARDAEVGGDELIAFVKERIARFKAPKRVVFGPLPKTATGKIQKFLLRERARGSDASAGSDR
jgi:fatty-acyl-CoA synthase